MTLNSYAQLEMIGFFVFVVWLFYYQSSSSRKAARDAEQARNSASGEAD